MTTAGRALVIGGRRGIGAAVVRAMADRGYAVTYTYRTDAGDAPEGVSAIPLDLSDRAAASAPTVRIDGDDVAVVWPDSTTTEHRLS